MTYNKFEQMLLQYGTNPDRWPADDVSAAEGLLSSNPAARELLERMEQFDTDLTQAIDVAPEGAALTGRVLSRVAARNKDTDLRDWVFGSRIVTALSGAAAVSVMVLGFFAGSLDIAWLDGTTGNDLSLLLLGETQEYLEAL